MFSLLFPPFFFPSLPWAGTQGLWLGSREVREGAVARPLPPGGVDIVAHAAAIIATVLVLRRLRVAATVSAWSAAALAALAVLLHDLTLVALAAAQSGRVGVAVLPLLVRVVVGGVIGLAVVGRWNRWAARERARGRA